MNALDRVWQLQTNKQQFMEQTSWMPTVQLILAFTKTDDLLKKTEEVWEEADFPLFLARYKPTPDTIRGTLEGRFWVLLALSAMIACFLASEGLALWYLYLVGAIIWLCIVWVLFLAMVTSISKEPGREYLLF